MTARATPLRISVLLVALVAFIAGCSVGRVIVPREQEREVSRVALLLGSAPVGVRPDRIEQLVNATEEALRSRGFSVVERERVLGVCPPQPFNPDEDLEIGQKGLRGADIPLFPSQFSAPTCAADSLINQFGLDALARLDLKSVDSNNFGVGYFASISGELSIVDRDSLVLEQVTHREGENSGVLGNSGQILQAFRSQAAAFSGESFINLTNRFAAGLVSRILSPDTRRSSNGASSDDKGPLNPPPMLEGVEVWDRGELLEICVQGSPGVAVEVEPLPQAGSGVGTRYSRVAGSYSLLPVAESLTSVRERAPATKEKRMLVGDQPIVEHSVGELVRYCGSFRFLPVGPALVRLSDPFGVSTQQLVDLSERCRAGGPRASTHGGRCVLTGTAVYGAARAVGPWTRLGVLPQLSEQQVSQELIEQRLKSAGQSAQLYAVAPRRSFLPVTPRLLAEGPAGPQGGEKIVSGGSGVVR